MHTAVWCARRQLRPPPLWQFVEQTKRDCGLCPPVENFLPSLYKPVGTCRLLGGLADTKRELARGCRYIQLSGFVMNSVLIRGGNALLIPVARKQHCSSGLARASRNLASLVKASGRATPTADGCRHDGPQQGVARCSSDIGVTTGRRALHNPASAANNPEEVRMRSSR